MSTLYRVYEPHELGDDGYPVAWHETIKHDVRAQAGHRCVRCGHPFVVGESGESVSTGGSVDGVQDDLFDEPDLERVRQGKRAVLWSDCDDRCIHGGNVRMRHLNASTSRWREVDLQGASVVNQLAYDVTHIAVDPVDPAESIGGGDLRIQAAWRILTVHHLNGRKFDCRWWNLAALCQRCHLTIQGKVQMERVYPFEHSDWFKPYAAGWYAYAYQGREITRDEAEADLDSYLALERIA